MSTEEPPGRRLSGAGVGPIRAATSLIRRRPGLCLTLVVLLYLALELPTVSRLGIGWDEQVDLEIARRYFTTDGGWARGSGLDPSQVRLPMYTVAILFALIGTDSLLAARLVSVALGGLALLGVYRFCQRAWDPPTGLAACLILGTSPFFLSFARVALTESDMFVTCALVWFLCGLLRLVEERTLGSAAGTGVALGLATSSKVSAAVLFPVAALAPLLSALRRQDGTAIDRWPAWPVGLLSAGAALGGVTAWWMRFLSGGREVPSSVLVVYFASLTLLAGLFGLMLGNRRKRISAIAAGELVVLVGFTVFMLFPPVHSTDPRILLAVAGRVVKTAGVVGSTMAENATFHALCVLFKSSPLVGVGLWLGLAGLLATPGSAWPRWILLSVFALYFAFLAKMNLAQTFYMMPLLPVLSMAAARSLLCLGRARPLLAGTIAATAFAVLLADLARCAPDYQLNGYQYLGERMLAGRSTVGYRSIVQVTTDGVEQSLRWLGERARPGETITTYVLAAHIVSAVRPVTDLRLRDGMKEGTAGLAGADWVVVSLDSLVADSQGVKPAEPGIYSYPFDRSVLEAEFEKVYAVRRAFGIEPAAVWRRR